MRKNQTIREQATPAGQRSPLPMAKKQCAALTDIEVAAQLCAKDRSGAGRKLAGVDDPELASELRPHA